MRFLFSVAVNSFISLLCTIAFIFYVYKLLQSVRTMALAASLHVDPAWNLVAKRTVRKFQIRLLGGGLLGTAIALHQVFIGVAMIQC
jgi:hypothetical protein